MTYSTVSHDKSKHETGKTGAAFNVFQHFTRLTSTLQTWTGASQEEELHKRYDLILTAQQMSREGLSPGRSGNVSLRLEDGFLITPTGMDYDSLNPRDIVKVNWTGDVVGSLRKPSSEWRFHLDIYNDQPNLQALVHCHSRAATVLACAHKEIPPFHYMIAAAGGKTIRCAPYATFGSRALSENAVTAMKDRKACLLANHGQIAGHTSLKEALELAREVEELAAQYVDLLKLGAVQLLSDSEMDEVILKFKSYGQDAAAVAPPKSIIARLVASLRRA